MGALRPGEQLAGTSYQVVRELGSGGMGVVYEVEHVRLKKRYVAKIIHERIKEDEAAARRMEREAQVLASFMHPHIVQVHDVGTTSDGVSYFVMEKLEGADLRQNIQRQSLARRQAIGVVADVLAALEYVHGRGVVHRDVKPENIFIAEQAPQGLVTKVLDFGIVHIFDPDGHVSRTKITKTGGFVGTLYYASPEHLQGDGAGTASDVYAAGLVLFELLAGRGPFDQDPGVGLSRCFKPAPLLHELEPSAPREISDLLVRVLDRDPAARPAAGALAAELRALLPAIEDAPLPPVVKRASEAPLPEPAPTPEAVLPPSRPQVTSGGVYATVEPKPGRAPAPKRSRIGRIAAVVAAGALAVGGAGVVLAKRMKLLDAPVTAAVASPSALPAAAPVIETPSAQADGGDDPPSVTSESAAKAVRSGRPIAPPAPKPGAPANKSKTPAKHESYVDF